MAATKLIKKSEIKAWKLTETEMFWAEDWADDLNKNREQNFMRIKMERGFAITADRLMLHKALKYYAKRYLKEVTGGCDQCRFSEMAIWIANRLLVSYWNVMRQFRGIAFNDPELYIAETFGLDTFGYYPKKKH